MVKGHHKEEQYTLAGNFHKPLHSTSGMMKLCSNETLQLVDILCSMTATKFSITNTRQERIDYILMSPDLVQSVCKKGYQSFDQMVSTDHRGMYLDLDIPTLFRVDTTNLIQNKAHSIRTKDPQYITKHITTTYQHLTDNNFWSKLGTLIMSQEPDHLLAEQLDRL
eukprot:15349080-Ditylum_brightwellii.AAC.1